MTAATGQARFRKTAVAMAGSTVASRVTGFGRVLALAYVFNFARLTDSYNLANTTPNIIYELILGGILSATLVPVFVDRLATKSEDDAWEAMSAVVTVVTVALVALSAAFFVAAPLIIHLYTLRLTGRAAHDQQAVATALLRMFAPQVFFYGLIALWSAVLNAKRRFVSPMATPVLNNLVVIGVLLAFPHFTSARSIGQIRHDRGALLLLGLGTTAGVAIQAVSLWPFVRRARSRLRWVWQPRHEAVNAVLRLSGWTLGYVAANQVCLWVVLILANGRSGDVSAYQAGYLFFLLPHAVFAVTIMTALLPDLSERWATGDRTGYRDTLSFGLRATLLVLLPAAAGYVVLGRPIVSVVLQHGRFSGASTRTTGDVLSLFALGLPAFSAYLLLMRAYQAMQNTRTMFFTYVIENGLNIALGLALYPALGVQGLALAFAIAYWAGTAVALWDLRRRVGGLGGRELAASTVRIFAAAAVMAAAVYAVSRACGSHPVLQVGAGVGVGVTVYLLAARALGVQELSALLRIRGRRA